MRLSLDAVRELLEQCTERPIEGQETIPVEDDEDTEAQRELAEVKGVQPSNATGERPS